MKRAELRWPTAGLGMVLLLLAVPSSRAHEGEQHGTPAATVGSLGPITLSDEAKLILGIESEEADLGTIEDTVTCYGSVEPMPGRVYWASPRFPGRATKVNFDSGQHVKVGDVLVEIESRHVAASPVVVPLTSRIDGTVTERNVSVGQPVEPDSVLYRISDLSTLYVKCNLFEIDAGLVRAGQTARIFPEAAGDWKFDGPIVLIGGALDETTRTLPVWIKVENTARLLRPGMRARVDLITGRAVDVVVVPSDAILGASGNLFVFLDKGAYYVGVPVGVGRRGEAYVEITDGLVPGDRVVTRGAYQIQFAASANAEKRSRNTSGTQDISTDSQAEDGETDPVLGVRLSELAQRNLGVEVETADFRLLHRSTQCFGMVEPLPANLHHSSTRIAGRVTGVHVLEGEIVERGQLLAEIETRQVGEPPPTVDIRATLDGVVTKRHVFFGEPVSADKSLFTIARLDRLLVKCHVPEPQVPTLTPGQAVNIYSAAYPDQSFSGSLAYLGGEVDENTRTLPAYILVDAPQGKLRPNMRVEVYIIIGKSDDELVAIPRSAVAAPEGGEAFVFVRSGDFFTRKRVQLGRRDARYVEVRDGILPGDVVVTQGNHALQFATNSPVVPEPGKPPLARTSGATKEQGRRAHE